MTQLQNLSNSVCSILLMPYLAFKVCLVRMEVLPDCKLEDLQQESMQLAAQGCMFESLQPTGHALGQGQLCVDPAQCC